MYDLGSYGSNKMGMTIRDKTCLKHTKLTSQLVLLVVGLRLSSLVLKLYVLTFLNNGMVMSVWDNPFHNTKKIWLKVHLSLTRLKISSSSLWTYPTSRHRNNMTTASSEIEVKSWIASCCRILDTQPIHICIYTSYIDV